MLKRRIGISLLVPGPAGIPASDKYSITEMFKTWKGGVNSWTIYIRGNWILHNNKKWVLRVNK